MATKMVADMEATTTVTMVAAVVVAMAVVAEEMAAEDVEITGVVVGSRRILSTLMPHLNSLCQLLIKIRNELCSIV